MFTPKAIGEFFPDLGEFEIKKLGLFHIPIKFFDGVRNSDANNPFDGLEDNYIGDPAYLELFGILSLGRFNKLKKKFPEYHINSSISAENLLEESLISNDLYRDARYIECSYLIYAPGKTGGRLIAQLAQGARRFASAYYKALYEEEKPNLLVPCNLKLIRLNIEKTKKLIEDFKKKEEGILNKILKWIMQKIDKSLIREEYNQLCYSFKHLKLQEVENALTYQKILEPVINEILNILTNNPSEKDLEKIFERINGYYTKEFRKAFYEV